MVRARVPLPRAAAVLHEASARREGLLLVAAYDAAVSLDLLLAAILAERGEPQDHHDLGRMAARVGVGLAEGQRAALGLFSDVLARLGRYRAPGGGGARDGSGEGVGTVRLLERPGAERAAAALLRRLPGPGSRSSGSAGRRSPSSF